MVTLKFLSYMNSIQISKLVFQSASGIFKIYNELLTNRKFKSEKIALHFVDESYKLNIGKA